MTYKLPVMINKIRQQEILIAYNSSFLSKIYFEKVNAGASDIYIELEKIEEACWNGLLEEVLPRCLLRIFLTGRYTSGKSGNTIRSWR